MCEGGDEEVGERIEEEQEREEDRDMMETHQRNHIGEKCVCIMVSIFLKPAMKIESRKKVITVV